MKKTLFIKNAIILTVCSAVLRLLGIVFKIWVASKVGSEGMGLYSLVLSVFFLFAAFSTTGICTAVTRLCSAEISLCRDYRPTLKKGLYLSVFTGAVLTFIMFFFSKPISLLVSGNTQLSLCFKIYSLCLLFMGIASVLRGFFFSVRQVKSSAFSQIAEQIIRIGISYALVVKFKDCGAYYCCTALVIGDTVSEILCPLILFIKYKRYRKRSCTKLGTALCSNKSILRIAFPLTAGKYLSLLLRTAETVLIPKMLKKGGMEYAKGIGVLGSIKAMALPILLFPSSLLNAISTLLIPEISSSLAKGRYAVVKDITEQIIKLTCIVSVLFACIFATLGNETGQLLYKNGEVGFLLVMLSPIVPLMYLDMIADGILKALDCQKFTFYTGIADSGMRVALIILLLPRFGITAFILIMYVSNFFTAVLNVFKLLKKSRANIDPVKTVFMPLCTALIITKTTALSLKRVAAVNPVLYLAACVLVSVILYAAMLLILGSITVDELKNTIA